MLKISLLYPKRVLYLSHYHPFSYQGKGGFINFMYISGLAHNHKNASIKNPAAFPAGFFL